MRAFIAADRTAGHLTPLRPLAARMPRQTMAGRLLRDQGLARQQGTTLAVSLIFLLLLTIIGVTAVTTTSLEEKMSANMKDQHVAFQASESALRSGEAWVWAQSAIPAAIAGLPGANQVWVLGSPGDFYDAAHDTGWWGANGVEYGVVGTQEITQASADPRFVIEGLGFVSDNLTPGSSEGRYFFRVTTHATGATATAQSVAQNTVFKRF